MMEVAAVPQSDCYICIAIDDVRRHGIRLIVEGTSRNRNHNDEGSALIRFRSARDKQTRPLIGQILAPIPEEKNYIQLVI